MSTYRKFTLTVVASDRVKYLYTKLIIFVAARGAGAVEFISYNIMKYFTRSLMTTVAVNYGLQDPEITQYFLIGTLVIFKDFF